MSAVSPGGTRSEGGAFRPELEGLRAVAVGLVLLYHAGVPGIGGGFVGVDVFFVLSGFLITGLIVRELDATGRIDLPSFYARRARRLLPAAAAAIAGTIILSAILLPPLRMPDVAGDAAAASLYVSNIRFAAQATDYLASDLAPSPLLHFWSLGVEEQFYLFWPALLLVAATVGRRVRLGGGRGAVPPMRGVAARSVAGVDAARIAGVDAARVAGVDAAVTRRRLALVIGVVVAASFAASLVLTSASEPWAFFSLPTRAWELGLGALVALAAARLALLPGWLGGVLVGAGLGLVAFAGVVISQTTPFPGTAALLPTIGAGLVIAGGAAGAATAPARLLARPAMRFLGRISYSLYLWHWPILVLPAAAIEGELPLVVRLGLAAISIGVAAASQRWIEDPIRHGRFVGLRVRRTLAVAGATSVAVALLSVGLGSAASAALGPGPGVAAASTDPNVLLPDPLASADAASAGAATATPAGPARSSPAASASASGNPTARPATIGGPVPANLTPSLAAVRSDNPAIYDDGCHLDIPTSVPKSTCVFGDPASPTTVVLFGDSHAAQWFPALDRLARVEGWKLLTDTKSACTPVSVAVYYDPLNRAYTECDAWRQHVFDQLATLHPTAVIVTTSRGYRLIDGSTTPTSFERPDLWRAGMAATLARLAGLSPHVVLLGDTPRSRFDAPVCLSAHLDDSLACATPLTESIDQAWTAQDARQAAAAGATFIDPTPWVCPTEPCPIVIGSYLVFRDAHHLTTAFATALAGRLLHALPPLPGTRG